MDLSYTDSNQGRDLCYSMVAKAIERVAKNADKSAKADKPDEPQTIHKDTSKLSRASAGETREDFACRFRHAVLEKYGTAESAYEKIKGKAETMTKKQLRKAMKKLGLHLQEGEKRVLKKILGSRTITLHSFRTYVDEGGTATSDETAAPNTATGLADLPPTVPQLPPSFKQREHPQKQLISALLNAAQTTTTSVTAPKSRSVHFHCRLTFQTCSLCCRHCLEGSQVKEWVMFCASAFALVH